MAKEKADEWTEKEKFCLGDCVDGTVRSTETDEPILTYSQLFSTSGVDKQGNSWEGLYQAFKSIPYKRTEYTKVCKPKQAGKILFQLTFPSPGMEIPSEFLGTLPSEVQSGLLMHASRVGLEIPEIESSDVPGDKDRS